ncbi:MAG: hypothetical protein CL948_02130 [Erythrobacter sp.]|nr:hypothetical protein [Erythrobacter sp.]
MAYFAVSYQLNNEKNYAPLWDALDDMGGHKVMNSFYFLDLEGTCVTIRDRLRQFIDTDDYLCVVRFQYKPRFTRALAGTNDWIEARF